MSSDERRERLRELGRRAHGAASGMEPAGELEGAPSPGDLLVLSRTAEHGLEWAVLETGDDRVLLVPADTNPLTGSTDVELPAHPGTGPLTLRCGHAVWVARRVLGGAHRTGHLPAAGLEAARRREHAVRAGGYEGSPTEREVDTDPEYEDWIAAVIEPARRVLVATDRWDRERRGGRGPRRLLWALAASLLAAFGLAWWGIALDRQVEHLEAPRLLRPGPEIRLGVAERGTVRIGVEEASGGMLLFLVLEGEAASPDRLRLEIATDGGERRWQSAVLTPGPLGELTLLLPEGFLAGVDRARLRLWDLQGDEPRLVEERLVEVTAGAEAR